MKKNLVSTLKMCLFVNNKWTISCSVKYEAVFKWGHVLVTKTNLTEQVCCFSLKTWAAGGFTLASYVANAKWQCCLLVMFATTDFLSSPIPSNFQAGISDTDPILRRRGRYWKYRYFNLRIDSRAYKSGIGGIDISLSIRTSLLFAPVLSYIIL